MDDDDDFFDTISFNSVASKRRYNSKDYIGLSRNTIYHSTYDMMDGMELMPTDDGAGEGDHQNKVSKNKNKYVLTYSEWRNRRSRTFLNSEISVDFVLAYASENKCESNLNKRKHFEKSLESVGLKLERDETQKVHFVKIHAPDEVLYQYAELLKLRLPIKDTTHSEPLKDNCFKTYINKIIQFLNININTDQFPVKKYQLTAEFCRDKKYLFEINSSNFLDTSVRITVVSYILERERYGDGDQEKGIKRLLSEEVYSAAYPLHDGSLKDQHAMRKKLSDEWAAIFPFRWLKFQPIDYIKDYFGVKFAIYFTWLGFYTHMLIPAAIVGIFCVIYAATTFQSNNLVHDICNKDIIMCPRCDKYCDYWKLNESCTYSKVQHFVDNPSTIFFALFMSFWAVLYQELWKRYSAEITHRWGLTGFDLLAEPPRSEYLMKLANAKQKINAVTRLNEPVVPFWRVKLPSLILSFSVALILVVIALGVVFGIVIYRMSVVASQEFFRDTLNTASYTIYVVPLTSGIINLICIFILNIIYNKVALHLTDMELQRTQTEHDDSLTLKIYMFQFVNYYSCIFYIAFLKGKFVGYPLKYNRIFGYRQEECNPGGCLMELTMQLAIIMIGKQFINAVVEMCTPIIMKIIKTIKITTGMEAEQENVLTSSFQWTEDYTLSEFESNSLFSEYLEMVLQYGFVTIFIAAFPLAPLFALINNVFEMRLDAKKFIRYYRRPIPQRVKGIGVWGPILAFVGRISVVSNAFIIAFSSNFIPRLVYMMKISENYTDEGFLDFSLAHFNTSDFPSGSKPESSIYTNITECRYSDFRNPQNDDKTLNYKRPIIYWHILAARLAFVVAYQNVVTIVITAVEWIIPDISRKLRDQIKREVYTTNELIIDHEARAKEKCDQNATNNLILSEQNGILIEPRAGQRSTIYFDADT